MTPPDRIPHWAPRHLKGSHMIGSEMPLDAYLHPLAANASPPPSSPRPPPLHSPPAPTVHTSTQRRRGRVEAVDGDHVEPTVPAIVPN